MKTYALGGNNVLLVWDGGPCNQATRFRPSIGGIIAAPPYTHIAEVLRDGNVRHLLAVRLADASAGKELRVVADDGSTAAERPAVGGQAGLLDPVEVLDGLTDAGRLRFARFLFETVGSLFRLRGNRDFSRTCCALFAELFLSPAPLVARCSILDRVVLAEGMLPRSFGGHIRAAVIGDDALHILPPASIEVIPATRQTARDLVVLLLPLAIVRPGAHVLLIGDNGIAGRRLSGSNPPPDASRWLASSSPAKNRLWQVLMDGVARLAAQGEAGASALHAELRAIRANGRLCPSEPSQPVAGGVDIAASNEAGIVVSGWLKDAPGIVAAIEIERCGRSTTFPIDRLLRFPHPSGEEHAAGREPAANPRPTAGSSGFALFAASTGVEPPLASVRVTLCLRSGTRLPLWTGHPASSEPGTRERVLSAVPPRCLTADRIGVIEPWLRVHQERRAATVAALDLIELGTSVQRNDVRASLVVPLCDDRDALRCLLTALAAEPLADALEMIFVADRSRCHGEAERLLRSLLAAYGGAARLVVLKEETDRGSILNAGAVIARSPLLVFLGSGVVPERRGWLTAWTRIFDRDTRAGVVGVLVLAEDQAVRSAGYDLADDHADGLDVNARFSGFPRDFPGIGLEVEVAAVSTLAMAVRRTLFEAAGGFDDRYLLARYRDADLCLEARRQGARVLAVDEPAMFDLGTDGRLEATHPDAAVCRALDQRLFSGRWRKRMAAGRDGVAADISMRAPAALAGRAQVAA